MRLLGRLNRPIRAAETARSELRLLATVGAFALMFWCPPNSGMAEASMNSPVIPRRDDILGVLAPRPLRAYRGIVSTPWRR